MTMVLGCLRMGPLGLLALIVAGGIGASWAAHADEKLRYGAPESWVKAIDIPPTDSTLADAATQWLLYNSQVKFAADGDTTYSEYALRVQNAQGMQSAQPSIYWDPATDTATVNKLVLIRDGQIIDLLKAGQTFTVVRREKNLELSMLDGRLTGVLQPEGLQVGDIVNFALTIKHDKSLVRNNSETIVAAAMSAKAGKVVARVLWDNSKPIRYRQSDDVPAPTITRKPEATEYFLQVRDSKEPDLPEDAPARFSQVGFVEFSQYANWEQVSALMAPLYDKATTLDDASPLKAEAAKIRAAATSPKLQAEAALELVESNVRYFYLGLNEGGYIPADADTTWRRRFGDCKGKTVLLLTLLHDLGIEAVPALVSTTYGNGLDEHLPSLGLFDHVIVRATIDGKVYWLDATRFGDSDIDRLLAPDYGWALPITGTGSDLEPLKVAPYEKPETEQIFRLDASAGLNAKAPAHFELIYRYDTALDSNLRMKGMSTDEKEKALKAYWSDRYDWIEVSKVSQTYDEATGEQRFTMDGLATMKWTKESGFWSYETDVTPIGWSKALRRQSGPHSDAPMVLNFPNYYTSHEEILLPGGGNGFRFQGKPYDETLASTQFHRTLSLKGNLFTVDSSKRSLVPEISYAEAMKVGPDLVKMWEDTAYLIAPAAYRLDTETASTKPAGEKTAQDYIDQAKAHMMARDAAAALTDYNMALRLDPANAEALYGRAFVFMSLGRADAAIVDFQQSTNIKPAFYVYDGLAMAYMSRGRYDEAIAAATQALGLFPNDVMAFQVRASAYLAKGERDKARADAQSALALDPSAPEAQSVLSKLDVMDGKSDDALSRIDKALEADPNNLALLEDKADVLKACYDLTDEACKKRKAQAIAVYDKIIAIKPDDYAYAMRAQEKRHSDHEGALADIDAALAINPKSDTALMVRAAIYMKDKAYDKALADLDRAVSVDPKDPEPLSVRSRLFFQMGEVDKALNDIDAIIALEPNNPAYLNGACWERATHDVQLEKAMEQCNAALVMAPQQAAYLDSRAFVELRLGQLDAALADYDAALKQRPDQAASLYGRGITKLRKGLTSEGESDLAAARAVYADIDKQFKDYGVTP